MLLLAVEDISETATTLNNMGKVYFDLNQKQKALSYFNHALSLQQYAGDRGNINQALTQIRLAIEIIESLRTKVDISDLRVSYFATVQDYYGFYIDLLMQLHQKNPDVGHNITALEISERARARSLLELLYEASIGIRQGIDPILCNKEYQLQQQLTAKTQALQHLLKGRLPKELKEGEKKLAEEFIKEIDSQMAKLQEIEAEIRIKSPRYAELKYPQPLNAQEIQHQLLDNETILLSYWLGDECSYLWAVTPTTIFSYQLPASSEIEAAAQEFYEYLTIPENREKPKKAAKVTAKLSQMLLQPVAEQLTQKVSILMYIWLLMAFTTMSTQNCRVLHCP